MVTGSREAHGLLTFRVAREEEAQRAGANDSPTVGNLLWLAADWSCDSPAIPRFKCAMIAWVYA